MYPRPSHVPLSLCGQGAPVLTRAHQLAAKWWLQRCPRGVHIRDILGAVQVLPQTLPCEPFSDFKTIKKQIRKQKKDPSSSKSSGRILGSWCILNPSSAQIKCLGSTELSRALYSLAQTCTEYKLQLNYTLLHQQQPTGRSRGVLHPRCLRGLLG